MASQLDTDLQAIWEPVTTAQVARHRNLIDEALRISRSLVQETPKARAAAFSEQKRALALAAKTAAGENLRASKAEEELRAEPALSVLPDNV